MTPLDEEALRADLVKPAFRLGQSEGRWFLGEIDWPHVLVGVVAADGVAFVLRFECSDYPNVAPTAGLWDPQKAAPLPVDKWPQSHGGRLKEVFRSDWEGGTALYLPCDRKAITTHPGWQAVHASTIWRPEDGICQYLETVHELLHCSDYKAADRPQA